MKNIKPHQCRIVTVMIIDYSKPKEDLHTHLDIRGDRESASMLFLTL